MTAIRKKKFRNKKFKSFKIPKGYKGLRADIELKLNSPIAVITGLNGSGKTTLLKHIFENAEDRSKVFFKTQNVVNKEPGGFARRRFKNDNFAHSFDEVYDEVLRAFSNSNRGPYTHNHELFSMLFDEDSTLYKDGYEFLEILSVKILSHLDYSDNIKMRLGVPTDGDIERGMIAKLNSEKNNRKLAGLPKVGKRIYASYKDRLLDVEQLRFIKGFEQTVIGDLRVSLRNRSKIKNRSDFESYIYELVSNNSFSVESIVEQLARRIYEDAKANSSKTKTAKLWQQINIELGKYSDKKQFNYEVNSPSVYSSNYEMTFKSTLDNKEVHFESLSSGEKIIFELVCYYFLAGKNKKLDTIILDEFDANLNPALAETYLNVVREQFADKGITTILTTHSPSTVAEVKPENLFEVSVLDGVQKIECANDDEGKKVILNKLAPNFVYYSEFGILEYVLKDETDIVVITEGAKDLENFEDSEKNHTFIACAGAGNIKNFLVCLKSIPFLKKSIESKTVIALFDFDGKGRSEIKDLLRREKDAPKDDDITRKITDKESIFAEYSPGIYLSMFTPPDTDNWDYTNSHFRHQELKKEGSSGLQRQLGLIEEIKNEHELQKML